MGIKEKGVWIMDLERYKYLIKKTWDLRTVEETLELKELESKLSEQLEFNEWLKQYDINTLSDLQKVFSQMKEKTEDYDYLYKHGGFPQIEKQEQLIKQLKEELSITQKAFAECSSSEMSCRESLPLARKKIDELYAEIKQLKEEKNRIIVAEKCECEHLDFEHPLFVASMFNLKDNKPTYEKPCKNCKCNNFKPNEIQSQSQLINQLKHDLASMTNKRDFQIERNLINRNSILPEHVDNLTINQEAGRLEYMINHDTVVRDGITYSLDKLKVYEIMLRVVHNWNTNNPTLLLGEP